MAIFVLATMAMDPVLAQEITLQQANALIANFPDVPNPPDPEILRRQMQDLANRLPEMQDHEVRKYFSQFMGVDMSAQTSYDQVRELSRTNADRILRALGDPRSFSEYALVRQAVAQYLSAFQHNTNQGPGDFSAQTHWLSSEQLRRLHLPEGLQAIPFNARFLGTKNWIFFHVGPGIGYGPHALFLRRDHAGERGFIFPFVMTVQDLIHAGMLIDPELRPRLERFVSRVNPDLNIQGANLGVEVATFMGLGFELISPIPYERLRATPELNQILTDAREALAKFALTADDFEKIAIATLARHLNSLKAADPSKYQRSLALLAPQKYGTPEFKFLIRDAFQSAGLPQRYEMRLPIAIETKHLYMPGCERLVVNQVTK